jgi:glycosyltransferase involved in cell wall biosynthesis
MPLALVEAMAAGCVVVGSAVPGIREMLVDGVDGFLVPHEDAAALAAVLGRLLAEPALAADTARRGRDRALADWSMAQMLARYEHAFAALAARPRGAVVPGP